MIKNILIAILLFCGVCNAQTQTYYFFKRNGHPLSASDTLFIDSLAPKGATIMLMSIDRNKDSVRYRNKFFKTNSLLDIPIPSTHVYTITPNH